MEERRVNRDLRRNPVSADFALNASSRGASICEQRCEPVENPAPMPKERQLPGLLKLMKFDPRLVATELFQGGQRHLRIIGAVQEDER
jgi:hypothetical protein